MCYCDILGCVVMVLSHVAEVGKPMKHTKFLGVLAVFSLLTVFGCGKCCKSKHESIEKSPTSKNKAPKAPKMKKTMNKGMASMDDMCLEDELVFLDGEEDFAFDDLEADLLAWESEELEKESAA